MVSQEVYSREKMPLKLVFNIKNMVISILFLILLFITCLENLSNTLLIKFLFKHIDEGLVVLLLIYDLFHISLLIKQKSKLIVRWLLFLFVGLVSTFVYQYQDILVSLIDMVTIISRFIIAYLAIYVYAQKSKRNLSDAVLWIAKLITIILLFLSFHDLIMNPFFARGDYRYFTNSLKLMFPHPTYLAACGVTLFIYFGYKGTKKYKFYLFASAFLVLSTQRAKALGFLALYIVFLILLKGKYGKKHPIQMALMGGCAAAIVGWEQIVEYFFTTSYSPRLLLLQDSVSIALNSFPFGVGYGAFGSSVAAEYYSPVYMYLGYYNNWGMSSDYTAFLSDNFWPTVIGEFGFIGLFIFISIIIVLLKYSLETYKLDKTAGFSMFSIMGYMILTSLAETSFFNPTSMLLFMMFAIFEVEARR